MNRYGLASRMHLDKGLLSSTQINGKTQILISKSPQIQAPEIYSRWMCLWTSCRCGGPAAWSGLLLARMQTTSSMLVFLKSNWSRSGTWTSPSFVADLTWSYLRRRSAFFNPGQRPLWNGSPLLEMGDTYSRIRRCRIHSTIQLLFA